MNTENGDGALATREQGVLDVVTLRFDGANEDGSDLHELRASHVAEVLQGLVDLANDFEKAGAFHNEGPLDSEVLVRPAQEGSFILEAVRVVTENWDTIKAAANSVQGAAAAVGVPSLGTILWWSTRSARAEVKDFTYLDNGNVKVVWQDNTAEEIPAAAWAELNKREPRRKKQLRKIMAPLEDPRVTKVDVTRPEIADQDDDAGSTGEFVLTKADFAAVKPDDEVEETQEIFETEAQMVAIDFDDSTRWKVKAQGRTRSATVEDSDFLAAIARGLPLSKDDIFKLKIREDRITKNGRQRTTWTVLDVKKQRRATDDGEP